MLPGFQDFCCVNSRVAVADDFRYVEPHPTSFQSPTFVDAEGSEVTRSALKHVASPAPPVMESDVDGAEEAAAPQEARLQLEEDGRKIFQGKPKWPSHAAVRAGERKDEELGPPRRLPEWYSNWSDAYNAIDAKDLDLEILRRERRKSELDEDIDELAQKLEAMREEPGLKEFEDRVAQESEQIDQRRPSFQRAKSRRSVKRAATESVAYLSTEALSEGGPEGVEPGADDGLKCGIALGFGIALGIGFALLLVGTLRPEDVAMMGAPTPAPFSITCTFVMSDASVAAMLAKPAAAVSGLEMGIADAVGVLPSAVEITSTQPDLLQRTRRLALLRRLEPTLVVNVAISGNETVVFNAAALTAGDMTMKAKVVERVEFRLSTANIEVDIVSVAASRVNAETQGLTLSRKSEPGSAGKRSESRTPTPAPTVSPTASPTPAPPPQVER